MIALDLFCGLGGWSDGLCEVCFLEKELNERSNV